MAPVRKRAGAIFMMKAYGEGMSVFEVGVPFKPRFEFLKEHGPVT